MTKIAVIRDESGAEILRFPVSDSATDEQIAEAASLLLEQGQKVPDVAPELPRVRCVRCDAIVLQHALWNHLEEHNGVQ